MFCIPFTGCRKAKDDVIANKYAILDKASKHHTLFCESSLVQKMDSMSLKEAVGYLADGVEGDNKEIKAWLLNQYAKLEEEMKRVDYPYIDLCKSGKSVKEMLKEMIHDANGLSANVEKVVNVSE